MKSLNLYQNMEEYRILSKKGIDLYFSFKPS